MRVGTNTNFYNSIAEDRVELMIIRDLKMAFENGYKTCDELITFLHKVINEIADEVELLEQNPGYKISFDF